MVRTFLGMLLLASPVWAGNLLIWTDLPPLPAPLSEYALINHHDTLIVAAGISYETGQPHYSDQVYALKSDATAWEVVGQLPEPRAGAAVASGADTLWLIGGRGKQGNFDDVLCLTWDKTELQITQYPVRLPARCDHLSAVLLNNTLYVAGNPVDGPHPQLWALHIQQPEPQWVKCAPPPVPKPAKPVLLAQNGALYLFAASQVFQWMPDKEWRDIAPPPARMAAGAPVGHAHLYATSDDTSSVYAYHTITDTWIEAATMPGQYGAEPVAAWQDGIAIIGNQTLLGTPAAQTNGLAWLDYAAITLYLGALILMGLYFSRREKNVEQFFLGGRRVPWWAVGLSIFGTSLSAITYLSIPARAYATNWVWLLANMGIPFIAPFVVRFYLPHYRKAPITTAYEYLETRFNLPMRIYGSCCFMAFQIGRVGIVMLLPAIALSAATGMNIYFCILAMGALATVYTALGGIEAVIWTDVLQAVVLVSGAILALILIVRNIDGGLSGMITTANAANKLHTFNWGLDCTTATVWVVLVGNAFSNLYPATADQTVVQRYLSTVDEKQAARAVWTNALLTIPISFLFFGLGTALWVYFRQHAEQLDPTLQNDAILPLFVVHQFPAGLKGLLIAGIFAAAMSSLDSSINSVSSVLVNDYYKRFKSGVTEQQALLAARLLTFIFGITGTLMALYVAQVQATSLWDPFLKLLNYVGGGLAGIFALGVFTRRTHGIGAMAGAIAGAVAIVFIRKTEVHFFLHGMAGFLAAFAVGYGVSLLFPGKPKNKVGS